MTTRINPDGTIDVRVVLTVKVRPDRWAETMMGTDGVETLQTDVRRDVKRVIGNTVSHLAEEASLFDEDTLVPINKVAVQGLYE